MDLLEERALRERARRTLSRRMKAGVTDTELLTLMKDYQQGDSLFQAPTAEEDERSLEPEVDNVQFLNRGSGGEENVDQGAAARTGAGSSGNDPNSGASDEADFDDIPFAHRSSRRLIVADIL